MIMIQSPFKFGFVGGFHVYRRGGFHIRPMFEKSKAHHFLAYTGAYRMRPYGVHIPPLQFEVAPFRTSPV